jgi:flagellin
VNLTGVTDTGTLATAVNQAIENAGNGSSQQATAFKNANITASITTDPSGKQQLSFSSASTAFQVQGDDKVSTALLGSYSTGSTGNVANVTASAALAFTTPTAETVNLRLLGAGLTGTQGDLSLTLAATDTADSAVTKINTAIAANSATAATGIKAVNNGGTLELVGSAGQSFEAQTAGDIGNFLGFGTYLNSTGVAGGAGTFDYNALTAGAASAAKTQGVAISVNGGAAVDLGVLTAVGTETTDLNTLNNAIQGSAALRAAGLQAIDNGGKIELTTTNGSSANFRVEVYGGTGNAFGFGASPAGSSAATSADAATTVSAYSAKDSIDSAGAQQSVNGTNSDVYQFTGLRNAGDAQTITISAVDATGQQHSLNVALTNSNAGTLDQALSTINSAILASNDSTLKQVAAFKEVGTTASTPVNGVEGVRFLSAGPSFKISLGASPDSSTTGTPVGITDGATGTNGGAVLTSSTFGTGSTADISNISTATAAVNQLALSVASLGNAQAAVGRGENQMNYSINLANSQLTNLASAESGIRDADMATASANLTKAQIQLQAGIAALAQANSAPQQVLSLLKQ